MTNDIFADLAAEQDRIEELLAGLSDRDWATPSAAAGWTVADVVLHLAQSEEAAAATASHGTLRGEPGVRRSDHPDRPWR